MSWILVKVRPLHTFWYKLIRNCWRTANLCPSSTFDEKREVSKSSEFSVDLTLCENNVHLYIRPVSNIGPVISNSFLGNLELSLPFIQTFVTLRDVKCVGQTILLIDSDAPTGSQIKRSGAK